MQHFVSKRSASSVGLVSSSLDDVRAERAAIVGHQSNGGGPPDAPVGSSTGNELCRSTSFTTVSSRMVSAYSGLVATRRPSLDRSHTKRSPTVRRGAAALVEDEPSGSGTKRRKIHVDPIVRDWFFDMSHQWETQRRWDKQYCLAEVQRLCPGMCGAINPNTFSLETERATSSTARQEKSAVTRRHDTAQRPHHAKSRSGLQQRTTDNLDLQNSLTSVPTASVMLVSTDSTARALGLHSVQDEEGTSCSTQQLTQLQQSPSWCPSRSTFAQRACEESDCHA